MVKKLRLTGLLGLVVLLIVTLLLNAGGFLIAFQVYKLHHYHQTIQRLQNQDDLDNLQRLAFANDYLANPDEDFEWEKDHEFRYNGGMYDIAERRAKDDSTIFFVERDRQEEKVKKAMKDRLQKNRNTGSPATPNSPYQQVLKHLVTQLYFESPTNISHPESFHCLNRMFQDDFKSRTVHPATPPPRIIG